MCTLEKHGKVYLLTLTGDGEHRLNPTLLDSIRSALAQIRSDSAHYGGCGSALVTAAKGKFFSNGFDLDWARSSPADRTTLMASSLQRTIADLISLPMPTIATVTGHAAAAGFALALSHDYVVMRSDRGFLYMSEVDIGLPFARYFMAIMRSKISDPRALRDVVLRGSKITAAKAVEMRIIDRAVKGAGETVEAALRLGEELAARNWDGHVYASIRKGAFLEITREVGLVNEDEEQKPRLLRTKL